MITHNDSLRIRRFRSGMSTASRWPPHRLVSIVIHIQPVRHTRGTSVKHCICMAGARPLAVISGVARSHGIGRECAKVFLEVPAMCSSNSAHMQSRQGCLGCWTCMQAGYKVVGLDLSPQEDPALQHVNYHFRTTDITNVDQTRQVAAHVSREADGLQVLINNAGIADPYLPEDPMERIAHWNKVIQTNLTGKQTFEVTHVY
ncbi:TPA: hypothetical protein ACH3X1_007287 [Trebouxia sp. C0004]